MQMIAVADIRAVVVMVAEEVNRVKVANLAKENQVMAVVQEVRTKARISSKGCLGGAQASWGIGVI
jgi:hypothetical protein